ncbi:hypothetical protein FRACYDRAFT_256209 [Fragilariopsis cylindrus CCMP1102]|uniref:Uncharacterized protein n=1 Tax=Fragilariopsis cylindrus CCMP1102 TaxID=635003 RepID=A0A1E7EJV9_9STRA|nr:hypothetical protein FRACYDRAFT_256209 [Fragilariopsis cylindrus CCMP1102]|eukprot:OEU06157.1 hypothetical protein FRACYDRAFT_256209 [Fragilariopsis cylindrus CCMP1102]
MSTELADSIVLAAHKMEQTEVEVISVIRYDKRSGLSGSHVVECSEEEEKRFFYFVQAYNYLAMEGYRKVSPDESMDFKKSLDDAGGRRRVVMVMSKKVNKEQNSTWKELVQG